MEINFTIFEKIRQYHENLLSGEDSSAVEALINSDSNYAFYSSLYQSMEQGIRTANKQAQTQWLKEQMNLAANQEEAEMIRALRHKDRFSAKKKQAIMVALPIAAIFLFLWLNPSLLGIGSKSSLPGELEQPITDNPDIDEENELFGTTGKARIFDINVCTFNVVESKFELAGGLRPIKIQQSSQQAAYSFKNDTLQLFLPNSKKLSKESISWIKTVPKDKETHYLQIEEQLYLLDINQLEKNELMPVENIPEMMLPLNN